MKQYLRHPWIIAVRNIAVAMAIFTVMRLFFYRINIDMFPGVSASHLGEMLFGGMRFDLTALLYLNALYLLMVLIPLPPIWRMNASYQKVSRWVYLIPNLIGIAVNMVDVVYVRFTDRRTSMTFFSEFQHDNNLASIFFQAVAENWTVVVVALLLMALLILLTRSSAVMPTNTAGWKYYLCESILFCVSVYFIVIGIRGGFGAYTRPITMSNALQYTNTPQETMIVLNTPFSLMRSTDSKTYHNPGYFAEEYLDSIYSPIHIPATNDSAAVRTPDNIVIILLESFSKEYIGFYNHHRDQGTYVGYTPFLDSLLQHSTTYKHSYASGRKSIDAMPSVLSSIPMLIEPYIVTPYSTNRISSIASCLHQCGYTTAFFHGAPNGSMGFQAYARAAGFETYYGLDEYNRAKSEGRFTYPCPDDDFDGTWAIWDEEFLRYYGETMSQMKEPFMTSIFTASSHHPFRVPARYEGVFPAGTLPIHPCIGYSDHALRLFFEYAKAQPWYEHTLFVLTADHTNQLFYPESHTAKGLYEIPIAFYHPGIQGAYDQQQVVSQTDIMPSVLAYLKYDKPFCAFGEDVLTKQKTHNVAICYNNPLYQMITDSTLIQFDGNKVTSAYLWTQDTMLQYPQQDSLWYPAASTDYLKAYIQQYIVRMIDNRLTAE